MDSEIASIGELVTLKLAVSRKVQVLEHDPKLQFQRMRGYEVFGGEGFEKRGSYCEKEKAHRKKALRNIFRVEFIRVAKKLKYFGLKPHEVTQLGLFTKIPYLLGKDIFKVVL